MQNLQASQKCPGNFTRWMAIATLLCFLASAAAAQTKPSAQPENPFSQEMGKYPGLMTAFSQLTEKLRHGVQLPPPRAESRLLPLLPESTVFYAAFPNYGEASRQTLTIFQQELRDNALLRNWWQHGSLADQGPKVEATLDKLAQLGQYLGDEIVLSGSTSGPTPGAITVTTSGVISGPTAKDKRDPSLLILAEVRKPGLKIFLQQMVKDLGGNSLPTVRILDVDELAAAKETPQTSQLVILVRPDLMVAALDLATLRKFNERMARGSRDFVATPFGQRLAKAYEGGTTAVAGADMQKILKQIPPSNAQNQKTFQRTGFADMKYLIWEHKSVAGAASGQMELSFTGPRHGIAAWLAAPAPMGSLDFVSPKAIVAGSVLLKNLGEVFDDINDLSSISNPNAFAGMDQMGKALQVDWKRDVLGHLTGELTFELDSLTEKVPAWKAILRVNDPVPLEATLNRLLANMPFGAQQSEEEGITYHTLRIPSAQKPQEIDYAFADGYLIIAPSRAAVTEAVAAHRTGQSMAKSAKFLAALPLGNLSLPSALLYEDPIAMAAFSLRQASPELADSLLRTTTYTTPVMVTGYGEESALRELNRSGGVDAAGALVIAAVAIPNLLRARVAANESSAAAMVHVVVVAQIAYVGAYPQKGYARDLAALGPDPAGADKSSPAHANLIDAVLGNASCTAGNWCEKSGFRFSTGGCAKQKLRCDEFVVTATPVNSNSGGRSFCSTSDGVVRSKMVSPLTMPLTASECRTWRPLQ